MKRANIFMKLYIMLSVAQACLQTAIVALQKVYFKGGYPRWFGDAYLKWWALKCLNAVRMDFTVNGVHKVTLEPGRSYIIMSNHRSHFDIPLMMLAMPGSIRMLTKKELFRTPIWGRGLTVGEFISIDRHDFEQAKRDLAKAREKMESGIVLWIAPEGTRSRTGRLGPFKKGGFIMAIEAGATIIPVGIQGTENVLKPETLDFYLEQKVEVNVGPPIEASRYTVDERDKLIEEVRSAIAELCGEAEEEVSDSHEA